MDAARDAQPAPSLLGDQRLARERESERAREREEGERASEKAINNKVSGTGTP